MEAGANVESNNAASTARESAKRRRLKCIVTKLPATAVKRGLGDTAPPRPTAWLRGVNEAYGSGSGGPRRGGEGGIDSDTGVGAVGSEYRGCGRGSC
jgi:hypothetical protein